MQVQKIQQNQQTFGTKVFVDTKLLKLYGKSRVHKSEFLELINKLENNGTSDTFQLSKVISSEGIDGVEASLCHIKDNKIYQSKFITYDAVEYRGNSKTHCVDIESMYNECRESMKVLINDAKGFMDKSINKLV